MDEHYQDPVIWMNNWGRSFIYSSPAAFLTLISHLQLSISWFSGGLLLNHFPTTAFLALIFHFPIFIFLGPNRAFTYLFISWLPFWPSFSIFIFHFPGAGKVLIYLFKKYAIYYFHSCHSSYSKGEEILHSFILNEVDRIPLTHSKQIQIHSFIRTGTRLHIHTT